MYEIKYNNITTISDTLVEVVLAPNGCYVAPKSAPADGFVGKIPTTIEQENEETGETEQVETLVDTVFVYEGHTMKGTELVGSWTEVPAVPVIEDLEADLEQAYELLYGGDE